jgi:hypothetical protein
MMPPFQICAEHSSNQPGRLNLIDALDVGDETDDVAAAVASRSPA